MPKLTGKNFWYSSCRGEFVNDYYHMRLVAATAVAPKNVASFGVSRKPCPEPVLEGTGCGKAEEGSGKKDSGFRVSKDKKRWICQPKSSVIILLTQNAICARM